ncbi:MAG: hypothetical protein LLG42_14775 [Chloroflexi bacterium]|nr:hypothetical protein [Chloroflexota bacterium]
MGKKVRLEKLNPFKDRTPVQRQHASEYLLITLISFATSVGGTRLFLEITGYPKLGSGEIHIAHVLWGGLFLFIASLLHLILANEWALQLSALLAGFGIGLFIDEVGKFITQTNDYFYPAAAPIVYVIFLLTVLLFAQIRNSRKTSTRAEMYGILEDFKEVLDHDLSTDEYNDLLTRLDIVITKNETTALVELAQSLKDSLEANRSRVVPKDPMLFDRIRIWALSVEKKWLDRKRLRHILIIGLLAWGVWALVSPIGFLLTSRNASQLQVFLEQLISNRLVRSASGLNWFEARVLLEGSVGVISLVAAGLMIVKAEKKGVWTGIVDLLITLTLVNPLVFYFDQFSSMIAAIFQFVLFIFLLRYRSRFLAKTESKMKD